MDFARLSFPLLRAALLVACAMSVAGAQGGPGPLDDARLAPPGSLRIGIAALWSAADRRFGSPWHGGSRAEDFGAFLSSDSLGTREVPTFGAFQDSLRRATGLADFRVNLGRARIGAEARATVVPIGIEYGISRRLSVGVVIPIVRSVVNLSVSGNVDDATANAGLSPGSYDAAEAGRVSQLASQFTSALTQLRSRYPTCFGSSPPATCADVIALESSARSYAAVIASTYGATALVPLAGTAGQDSVRARLDAFNAQFRTQLGLAATANPISVRPRGALPIGVADIYDITRDSAFGIVADSLRPMELTSLGDVEAGITVGLIDRSGASSARPLRVSASAIFRYGLAHPMSAGALIGPSTGDGQHDVEARLAADLGVSARVSASAFLRYTHQLADDVDMRLPATDVRWLPASQRNVVRRNLGDETAIDVLARVYLNSYLGGTAGYGFTRRTADTFSPPATVSGGTTFTSPVRTGQTFALGIHYSTVDAYLRGRSWAPLEVGFLHRHTFAGSGGIPRMLSDAVALRVYVGGVTRGPALRR